MTSGTPFPTRVLRPQRKASLPRKHHFRSSSFPRPPAAAPCSAHEPPNPISIDHGGSGHSSRRLQVINRPQSGDTSAQLTRLLLPEHFPMAHDPVRPSIRLEPATFQNASSHQSRVAVLVPQLCSRANIMPNVDMTGITLRTHQGFMSDRPDSRMATGNGHGRARKRRRGSGREIENVCVYRQCERA